MITTVPGVGSGVRRAFGVDGKRCKWRGHRIKANVKVKTERTLKFVVDAGRAIS
jgi:hypothetical protein